MDKLFVLSFKRFMNATGLTVLSLGCLDLFNISSIVAEPIGARNQKTILSQNINVNDGM